jgi:hypothetical protein
MRIFMNIVAHLNFLVGVVSHLSGRVPEATYFLVFALILFYLADRNEA